MTVLESIFLGIIQGLSEFLPISSSGHLALAQNLLNIKEPTIYFDTILHLGTLVAVIFYLRREILDIVKNLHQRKTQKIVWLLILATLPAVVLGLLLKDKMEIIFASYFYIGLFFIATSVILYITRFFKEQKKDIQQIGWGDALFMGVFQAAAILPGVSRSGSTISASVYRGIKREDAFKFSFLMSIPVILGAFILQAVKQHFNLFDGEPWQVIFGFIFSAIFGLISLKIIEKVMIKGRLHYFAVYCFLLGLTVLIFIH